MTVRVEGSDMVNEEGKVVAHFATPGLARAACAARNLAESAGQMKGDYTSAEGVRDQGKIPGRTKSARGKAPRKKDGG